MKECRRPIDGNLTSYIKWLKQRYSVLKFRNVNRATIIEAKIEELEEIEEK